MILFYLLIKNAIELSDPANSESGNSWLGIGPPLADRRLLPRPGRDPDVRPVAKVPSFFKRKPEVAPAGFLEGEVELPPAPIAGGGE